MSLRTYTLALLLITACTGKQDSSQHNIPDEVEEVTRAGEEVKSDKKVKVEEPRLTETDIQFIEKLKDDAPELIQFFFRDHHYAMLYAYLVYNGDSVLADSVKTLIEPVYEHQFGPMTFPEIMDIALDKGYINYETKDSYCHGLNLKCDSEGDDMVYIETELIDAPGQMIYEVITTRLKDGTSTVKRGVELDHDAVEHLMVMDPFTEEYYVHWKIDTTCGHLFAKKENEESHLVYDCENGSFHVLQCKK